MKLKRQLILAIMAAGLLTAGIVYGDDPVKDKGTDSTSGSPGLGWQEGTQRKRVLYTDGLRLNTGLSFGITGVSLNLGVSTNIVDIYCCMALEDIHSWCNFNADDERCGN